MSAPGVPRSAPGVPRCAPGVPRSAQDDIFAILTKNVGTKTRTDLTYLHLEISRIFSIRRLIRVSVSQSVSQSVGDIGCTPGVLLGHSWEPLGHSWATDNVGDEAEDAADDDVGDGQTSGLTKKLKR